MQSGRLAGVAKHIQIRDVPDTVHATLRERAAKAGVSLSEYLRRDLAEHASRPTDGELFDRLARGARSDWSFEDAVTAVRAERDVP